jgi:hypothetical protein
MKRIGVIVAIVAAAIMLTSCVLGLSVQERVDAFIADMNADSRDYEAVKAHFSEAMNDYGDLQLSAYWSGTFFGEVNRVFSLSNMELNEAEDGGYTGGVTYAGQANAQGDVLGPYNITFVLVPVELPLGEDWLIRYILVEEQGGGLDIPISNYW